MEEFKLKRTNIESITEFWSKYHDIKYTEDIDFIGSDDDLYEQGLLKAAELLRDNRQIMQLFIMSEVNYDIDKANELIEKQGSLTKIAEYLNLKFYDHKDPWSIINLAVNWVEYENTSE